MGAAIRAVHRSDAAARRPRLAAAGVAAATLVAASLVVAPSAGADDHDKDDGYGKYYDEQG
jgi:hypothetical protein